MGANETEITGDDAVRLEHRLTKLEQIGADLQGRVARGFEGLYVRLDTMNGKMHEHESRLNMADRDKAFNAGRGSLKIQDRVLIAITAAASVTAAIIMALR